MVTQKPAPACSRGPYVGAAYWNRGQFGHAKTHLDAAWAIYCEDQYAVDSLRYGQDPGLASLFYLSLTLWAMGYADQSAHNIQEALTLAHDLDHPFQLAFAYNMAAALHSFSRDIESLRACHAVALELSRTHGFASFEAESRFYQGYVLAHQKTPATWPESLAIMRQALNDLQQSGLKLSLHHLRALLAEQLAVRGRIQEGLELIGEALAAIPDPEQHPYGAELYRLQGDLLLRLPTPTTPEAEAALHRALAIARAQQARVWELRAATRMGRWWQEQGADHNAHQLLTPIFTAFTEGFETVDLRDAGALLTSLDA